MSRSHSGVGEQAEPITDTHVVRWELMGGTLTSILFVAAGPSAGGEEGYIDALLGPERTRECFFSG